jgi:hypothetical protein
MQAARTKKSGKKGQVAEDPESSEETAEPQRRTSWFQSKRTRNPLYDVDGTSSAPEGGDEFGFPLRTSVSADSLVVAKDGSHGDTEEESTALHAALSELSLPGACESAAGSGASNSANIVDVDQMLSMPASPSAAPTNWSEPTSPPSATPSAIMPKENHNKAAIQVTVTEDDIHYDPMTGAVTVSMPADVDDELSSRETPISALATRPTTPTMAAVDTSIDMETAQRLAAVLVPAIISTVLPQLCTPSVTKPVSCQSPASTSDYGEHFINPADSSPTVGASTTQKGISTFGVTKRGTVSLPTTRQHSRSGSVASGSNLSLNEMVLTTHSGATPFETGTAVPMYVPASGELSLQACLAHFCTKDTLKGDNAYQCSHCGQLQAGEAKECLTATNACIVEEQAPDDDDVFAADLPAGEGDWVAAAKLATLVAEEAAGPAISPRKVVAKPIAREASKQMLIESVPPVLTIQLKRFQQTGIP